MPCPMPLQAAANVAKTQPTLAAEAATTAATESAKQALLAESQLCIAQGVAAADRLFVGVDQNGDGNVSVGEWGPEIVSHGCAPCNVEIFVPELDLNADARISTSEATEVARAWFTRECTDATLVCHLCGIVATRITQTWGWPRVDHFRPRLSPRSFAPFPFGPQWSHPDARTPAWSPPPQHAG